MRKWITSSLKFLRWLALLLVAGFIVLLPVSYFWLQSTWGKNWIADKIQDSYNSRLTSTLHIGSIEGRLPVKLILNDAHIVLHVDSNRVDTVVTVKKVELSLRFWNVLYGQLQLTNVSIIEPTIFVDRLPDSTLGIVRAMEPRSLSDQPSETFVPVNVDLYAPIVAIHDGAVLFGEGLSGSQIGQITVPSTIDSVEARFFVEVNRSQRFIDIVTLTAQSREAWIETISLSGQFFSDIRYTELRRLNITSQRSSISADVIMDGPDINRKGWTDGIDSAYISLNIKDTRLHPNDFRPWFNHYPALQQAVGIDLIGSGSVSDITIESLDLRHNESHISATGTIRNAFSDTMIEYASDISEMNVGFDALAIFMPKADTLVTRALSETTLSGMVYGNADSLSANVDIVSPAGEVKVNGGVDWATSKSYRATLSSQNLNFDRWEASRLPNTVLRGMAFLDGNGFDKSAVVAMTATVENSVISGVAVDTLRIVASLNNSELQSRFHLASGAGKVTALGNALIFELEPEYHLEGSVQDLDLSSFRSDSLLPKTRLSANFSLDLYGADVNSMYGRASIDGGESVVADQVYPAIQAYADISEPIGGSRTFRLTSSFLDAVITGNLVPETIQKQMDYWIIESSRQVNDEFLRGDGNGTQRIVQTPVDAVSLDYSISIKQMQTLRRLITQIPDIETNAHINGTLVADSDRMLLNLAVSDDSTHYDNVGARGLDLRLTMALQHGLDLGSSANIQMTSNVGLLQIGRLNLENIQTRATLLSDSVFVSQTIANIGDGARARYTIQASIEDSTIAVSFPTFFLGNNQYSWRASETPRFSLLPGGKIAFIDFRFENANQSVMLDGILSEDIDDQLALELVDVDLERISELMKVRFTFGGILSGLLQTRSLRTQTNIEGRLRIDALALNNRVVGDILLDSEYNNILKRFDTSIKVKTDSLKYAEYFDRNNGIGQDVELVGYLAPRNLNPDIDHLFNFDVNLKEVDLWIIRYILLDVFTKIEGKATGSGNVRGDFGTIVYDATFNIENAQVIPVFLNTNYVLNGDISFTNADGLVFNNVRVNDDKRGTGVLSGNVDLNDFKPEKYLDLRLRLNRLEFLNNTYDPDIPFYGRVSGSGDIRLFGPTTKMFLQTLRPITVTPNSKLLIPLLDETAINQQTNFIRFVNEFFEQTTSSIDKPATDVIATTPRGRNFYDIFQLDLQFNMPQDAAIEFIFDPVTNEYLTTRGTGSVRITLENANLGMFGTFDIDRGEYNFVGGDIFSKKFKIRQGGQVVWDGIAQDPMISVTAYFSARPNLSPLGTGRDVRAPIDLILNLNGRMGSLENDFYFAYPTTNFDQGLTASELNILNGEDQKLLQATSLLITGNFLPVNQSGQTDVNIQNKMTQAGIGQLLSSQINYLLNSSLSNFDFDLNLTGFDQADLGIGLRLFDDRLELRRDGTIVGDQTNIGDLAATYRINRFFSVEIFHRQDVNSTRGLSQEGTVDRVNGVGLQYQIEFSSWKKFLSDIWRVLTGTGS